MMIDTSKWDKRFLRLAREVGSWSKDPSTQVGCVLVGPGHRIISLGFNGLPRGIEDSFERLGNRLEKLALTIHAEENALLFARTGLEGCEAFVTHHPCSHCAVKLIQAGVKRIVYIGDIKFEARWEESLRPAKVACFEAGVKLTELTLKEIYSDD